jgi:hypothetical protein
MSALELDPIVLSLNVKLSIVVVPTKLVAPVTFNVDSVVNAEGTAKVELRFTAPESVAAPETFIVPSTIKPSLMLIMLESSELKLVPLILSAPNITDPVPLGSRLIFSFDLVPSMALSLIRIAGKDIAPVPEGLKTRSSLDLVADISLPLKLRSPPERGDR